jgi:hypothetical protein
MSTPEVHFAVANTVSPSNTSGFAKTSKYREAIGWVDQIAWFKNTRKKGWLHEYW